MRRSAASNAFHYEPLEPRQMMSASPVHPTPKSSVVPGEWILSASPQMSKGGVAARVRQAAEASKLSLSVKHSLTVPGLSLIQAASDVSLKKLRAALSGMPGFGYVEPNYKLFADRLPNDPRFNELYGLDKAHLPQAWDQSTGNGSVVVGVIDTGVDYTHPDLAANMWHNPGETPGDKIDNDGNGFVDDYYGWDFCNDDSDPFDDQNHGTHVSGTIAGVGNNGVGVTGVNWNAKIMALKFLGADGSGTTEDAVDALHYATMMRQRGVNIRLTSNSWGGGDYSQALYDEIKASGDAGMLFVAAAGNDGESNEDSPHYPSNYDLQNLISVAATDSNDDLADFSNFGGASVDLGAPGVEILSTLPNNSYEFYSGTSMATPHVSGVAALAWSVKPTASWQFIRDAIFGGTDRITSLQGVTSTGGRLNAKNTLDLVSATSPIIVFGGSDSSLGELNDPATVTVLRFGNTNSPLTIPFTVAGSATSGVDYTLSATSFTIPAGASSATITITPIADLQIEGDETIQFTLGTGAGYALGPATSMTFTLSDHIPAPANDNFADAPSIPNGTTSLLGTTQGASLEPDEPHHAGLTGGHSVWWNWTASFSGTVVFHTHGSDFETLLAVYTGSTLPTLTPVASSGGSIENGNSVADFTAVAGQTYHIAVDGWLGDNGHVQLNIARAPTNDAFTSRVPLSGYSPTATGTNLGASIEAGEPEHGGSPGGHSVWWTWTAPLSAAVTIDTWGSNFSTDVGVYTGTSVSNLTEVPSNGGSIGLSLSFNATAGQTYQIAVDGFYGAVGEITLNIGYASGATVSWDGGGDGVNWSDPLNWSGDVVPGPTNDVSISDWRDPTIRITSGTHAVRSITSFEAISISGGVLDVAYDSDFYDNVTFTGGEFGGRGDLHLYDTTTWTGGSMTGAGTTIIGSSGSLVITGTGTRSSDRPLQINGTASLQRGGSLVLRTNGLAIAEDASLDLADNSLIVDYTGPSPVNQISDYLTGGYAGGAWNGHGIKSSVAATATGRTLGFAEASDSGISAGSIFSAQPIDSTAVIVRYTLAGDANLDRKVDISDLGLLASNWQATSRRFSQGDFNFDHKVDISDLGNLASNWQAAWSTTLGQSQKVAPSDGSLSADVTHVLE
jgi:subtilisin family serine protease